MPEEPLRVTVDKFTFLVPKGLLYTTRGFGWSALESAEKYSLVANSVKSRILIEPEIEIVE